MGVPTTKMQKLGWQKPVSVRIKNTLINIFLKKESFSLEI